MAQGLLASLAGPWRRVPLPVEAAQLAEIAQQKQLLAKADAMYEDDQARLRAAEAAKQAAVDKASKEKALEEKKERENLPGILAERKEQEEREAEQQQDRKARGKARELARKRREQEDKEFDRKFGKGAAALRRELMAPYPSRQNQKGVQKAGRGGKSTRAVWGWTGSLGGCDDGD